MVVTTPTTVLASVVVLETAFDGSSWAGSAFDSYPDWLRTAVNETLVRVEPDPTYIKSDDGSVVFFEDKTPYAWWRVSTIEGDRIVGPGDIVISTPKGLGVRFMSTLAAQRFGVTDATTLSTGRTALEL